MRIIVTGGSGFLGTHLCRSLAAEGHQVTNIDLVDNPEFPALNIDVRDLDSLKTALKDADAVFHLASLIQAGESVQQPQLYVDVNITGSLNVLEAMRHNNITTFLFSSSAAIYGEPLRSPIEEDDRTIPINPYGVTKLTMEGMLRSYVESYNFTGVALRYFNLYGPEEQHQPETHAIPRFIDQIAHGKEVTVWGEGQHLRDYIYISDVVAAHIKALELTQQQPHQYHYMNLSTGHPNSVMEVIQTISRIMKKPANIKHFPDRPGDPLVLTAKPSKAHEVLGWKAEVDLETGLRNTIEYFQHNPSKHIH